ncbi:MAG: hypothetical protein QM820_56620 [Minicystis sp.]
MNWITSGIFGKLEPVGAQVLAEVVEGLGVVLRLAGAGVGDQRHAVRALEHEPPRGRVDRLPRHREELDLERDVPVLGPEGEREQVEEQRAVVLRLERHETAAGVCSREGVERHEVGGLSAERGAVVDELDRHLARGEVELHRSIVHDHRRKGKPPRGPSRRSGAA